MAKDKCVKKANKIFRKTGSSSKAEAALKKCYGVRALGSYGKRRKHRKSRR